MELAIGFVLGIVASVIASFMVLWLTGSRQRPILSAIRNPGLRFRLLRQTPEREIAEVITRLFRAWEQKNLELYLSCWSDDCIRIQGATSNVKQDKNTIGSKFMNSCAKYASIVVPTLIFEDIGVASDGTAATAHVYYRFELIRSPDALPTIEYSREVYSLRRADCIWRIAANIDHFKEIAPSATMSE
jgi:Domain of unknown function (DUF4440)